MQLKLRPNKNCGCTIEQALFVVALYYYVAAYHARQLLAAR